MEKTRLNDRGGKLNTGGTYQNAGRKPKKFKQHIADLKKLGYAAPSREEYHDIIGLLLAVNEDDLANFAKDKTRPYWIRLIVIDLQDKKNRQRLMADHRDWLFGRASQNIDHTTQGEKLDSTPAITVMLGDRKISLKD